MTETVACLDRGVWIKFLVPEVPPELGEAADQVVRQAFGGGRVVAPGFAWAEVDSMLRRKVRQQVLSGRRAEQQWLTYLRLPIEFIDVPALRGRSWEMAERYALPTLYDASFLACTEVAPAAMGATRAFWTTDVALLRSLGASRPSYVRQLGVDSMT